MTGPEAVRAYVDAFNAEDLDALTAVLAEDVEIQAGRGLLEGHDEARRWATRKPSGELHQRLVLDDAAEHGAHTIATVRRQWAWRESDEVADEQEIFYVATMRDGLIARWAPFEDREQALRAAGAS
jgi:ketosteroid isomerase-like protein